MDIKEQVYSKISGHFGVGVETLTDETNVYSDLHCDSLDIIELVIAFEEKFDINVEDSESEEWKCIGDAISTIERLSNQRA